METCPTCRPSVWRANKKYAQSPRPRGRFEAQQRRAAFREACRRWSRYGNLPYGLSGLFVKLQEETWGLFGGKPSGVGVDGDKRNVLD